MFREECQADSDCEGDETCVDGSCGKLLRRVVLVPLGGGTLADPTLRPPPMATVGSSTEFRLVFAVSVSCYDRGAPFRSNQSNEMSRHDGL